MDDLRHVLNDHQKDKIVEDPDGMITITSYIIGALVAICCLAYMLGISIH